MIYALELVLIRKIIGHKRLKITSRKAALICLPAGEDIAGVNGAP